MSDNKTRRAGKRREAGISREEILRAAITAFSRNGYRGTNLGDVAAVLGVTRQAIYYHYRDKHAILLEMFEVFFNRLGDSVAAAREAEPDPSLRFERILSAHIVTVADAPEMSSVFTREYESLNEDAKLAIRQRRRLYQEMFVQDFEAAQAAGRFRDLPPAATVSLLFGAANWTFRWYRPRRAGMTSQQLANLALDLFKRGLDE